MTAPFCEVNNLFFSPHEQSRREADALDFRLTCFDVGASRVNGIIILMLIAEMSSARAGGHAGPGGGGKGAGGQTIAATHSEQVRYSIPPLP